jgi:hypothetical protein
VILDGGSNELGSAGAWIGRNIPHSWFLFSQLGAIILAVIVLILMGILVIK